MNDIARRLLRPFARLFRSFFDPRFRRIEEKIDHLSMAQSGPGSPQEVLDRFARTFALQSGPGKPNELVERISRIELDVNHLVAGPTNPGALLDRIAHLENLVETRAGAMMELLGFVGQQLRTLDDSTADHSKLTEDRASRILTAIATAGPAGVSGASATDHRDRADMEWVGGSRLSGAADVPFVVAGLLELPQGSRIVHLAGTPGPIPAVLTMSGRPSTVFAGDYDGPYDAAVIMGTVPAPPSSGEAGVDQTTPPSPIDQLEHALTMVRPGGTLFATVPFGFPGASWETFDMGLVETALAGWDLEHVGVFIETAPGQWDAADFPDADKDGSGVVLVKANRS